MYTETNVQEEQHLFTDLDVLAYQEASVGQRFVNYLVDALLMQYGLSFLTGALLSKVLMALNPDLAVAFFSNDSAWDIFLSSYGLSILNYTLYYTICELGFKGYTLGKLITGTRAVRADGSPLAFKDALLRSLTRLVPFEAFSALGGDPWHDRWTKTMVVKAR